MKALISFSSRRGEKTSNIKKEKWYIRHKKLITFVVCLLYILFVFVLDWGVLLLIKDNTSRLAQSWNDCRWLLFFGLIPMYKLCKTIGEE